MTEMYYLLENEHDGMGWFYPLGKIQVDEYRAKQFIKGQHYAWLRDCNELGFGGDEPDFKMVKASELKNEVAR